MRQVFVGADDSGGVESSFIEPGPDDVDAVEGRFGRDLFLVATVGKCVVGDGRDEVFADLVFVDEFAESDSDFVGTAQAAGGDRRGEFVQVLFGGGQ